MIFNLIILRKGNKKEFFKGKRIFKGKKGKKVKKERQKREERQKRYKKRRQRKRRRQRKERGQEKRRRQRKGCITASLCKKMIDSISANYRNHNCQCFINETNYLS